VVKVGESLANFWPLGGVGRSVVVYVRGRVSINNRHNVRHKLTRTKD
jgi:hypothetical protein